MPAHITKAAIDKAVRKIAKATDAPFLLPTRTRNFLKQEAERLEKEAKQRDRKATIKPEGRKPTIIHVNQLVIRQNRKHGTNEPPLTIRKGRNGQNASRAHEVELTGPSKIIHSPDKPLKCGARVWIETHHPVKAK